MSGLPSHDSSESMTVALFDGPGQAFRIHRLPVPVPQSGEVLVRIDCCTLCGSDLHSISGHRSCAVPSILGHEIVGHVVAVDPDQPMVDIANRPLLSGDRVTWSIACSCRTCFFCKHGLPQKCESLFKYGHEPFNSSGEAKPSGGLGTHCLLKAESFPLIIPESISDEIICPANCATATVMAALRTVGNVKGSSILIVGAGMLGMTACAAARESGADWIMAVDRNAERAAKAVEFGADLGCFIGDGLELARQQMAEQTDRRGIDVVLEFSGAVKGIELGLESLRIGGRLLLVGSVFPTPPVSLLPERVVRNLLRIEGLHNYRPEDLRNAVEFLCRAHESYPFEQLVERTFLLSELDDAVQYAREKNPFRVSIRPTSPAAG